jgi:hypothetical protein
VKARIYSHSYLIGTADLMIGDQSMSCLYGDFTPTERYYSQIQKHVWAFYSDDIVDYSNWNSLRLNVCLENGYFLLPQGGITFDDSKDFPDEIKRIDIAGVDSHVINDFFLAERPKIFVEEPWNPITIGQKIRFEDELRKELGQKVKHQLAEFQFSALCVRGVSNNVLFTLSKPNSNLRFSVVHLTWKESSEQAGDPKFEMFEDFDSFRYFRAFWDKAEWEW